MDFVVSSQRICIECQISKRGIMEEHELLVRLSEGDSWAFACLFQRYYKDLVLFAGTYLTDKATCEDIVQDVFTKLYNGRAEAKKIQSLRSFLLRSVQNACLNEIRRDETHRRYVELNALKEEASLRETENYLLYSELSVRLQEVLTHLSPIQRQCFEMNRMQGMKQADVAKELDIPLRTVEARIAEALKILKFELKDYFAVVLFFFTIK